MKNSVTLALTLIMVFAAGIACDKFKSTTSEPPAANANSNKMSANASTPAPAKTDSKPTKIEKPDFTMTAEQYDAEFYKKGVKSEDLEKYSNRIIQVSGRVSMLETEKHGTTLPWVTLFAPGTLRGVSCYFDDADVDQMKKLTMNKTATVQGFQGSLLVPEVSPMLDHCVVVEGS